jgi:hypothetical protein
MSEGWEAGEVVWPEGYDRRTTTEILYRCRSEAKQSRDETATSWSAKNFCHTPTMLRQRSAQTPGRCSILAEKLWLVGTPWF